MQLGKNLLSLFSLCVHMLFSLSDKTSNFLPTKSCSRRPPPFPFQTSYATEFFPRPQEQDN